MHSTSRELQEMGAQPNPRHQLPLLGAWGCRKMGMRGWGEGWCSVLTSSCPAKATSMAEAAPHGDLPASVPPTQPGRGITQCQKSDKKGKKQNRNWNYYRLDIDPVQGFVVNHTVELRMLQIPLPRGTQLGASNPFSIPAAQPEPQPRSPPSRARRCFFWFCFFKISP